MSTSKLDTWAGRRGVVREACHNGTCTCTLHVINLTSRKLKFAGREVNGKTVVMLLEPGQRVPADPFRLVTLAAKKARP